jgi:CheY-like chemotaxis protein
MDRATLLGQARDALGKLYQESLLQIHPLAGLLLPEIPVASRGIALKQLLFDVMQQLRPPHTAAYQSPSWRRYRSLFQFYMEGKSFEEIAHEQGVSERQARRDHHQAIEALGDFLWARYCEIHHVNPPPSPEEIEPGDLSRADEPSLEDELRRIGSLPAGELVRIDETLRGVITVIQKLTERLRTRVDLAVAENLPSVAANQMALRQALLSALSWIMEATPGGSVVITATDVPRGVDLRIRAQGWQRGNALDVDDGSRLALSRRLVEMQGGRLDVHVEDVQSISLRLTLPSAEAPIILVVDDNPDVLRLFERYLQASRNRLIQATSAEQALQFMREARPCLITLDLMMPYRDGWELLQILRRDDATRDIPIVVCSVVHERTLALTVGASYFLPKPISRAALLEVLEQCGLGPVDSLEATPETTHQFPDRETSSLGDSEELGGNRLVGKTVPGHQDHWDVPRPRSASHPPQKLVATQVGHDEIEKHGIRTLRLQE